MRSEKPPTEVQKYSRPQSTLDSRPRDPAELLVPLVIVLRRIEGFESTSVKEFFTGQQALIVMLHLLKFVPGRQQVLVHDLFKALPYVCELLRALQLFGRIPV
jgi:hypothetical protein